MSSTEDSYFNETKILPEPFTSKEWDGDGLPKIITKITTKWNGKMIFGGSSLLHLLYFKDEDWGNKDYDIWSCTCVINEMLLYLQLFDNIKIEKLVCSKYFSKYAGVSIIHNVYYDDLKIQLLILDKFYCIQKGSNNNFVQNIDFSFLRILYDGNRICYYVNDLDKVKAKKGKWIQGTSNTPKSKWDNKKLRIDKYIDRGFTFENICNFCDFAYPSHEHLCACLNNKYEINSLSLEDIGEKCHKCSERIIFLTLVASKGKIDLFKIYFEKWKTLININYENEYLFNMIVNTGAYTLVKLVYEYASEIGKPISLNANNNEAVYCAYKKNYINTIKYLCEINSNYEVEICEDRIVKFSIKNIFDRYIDSGDKMFFIKEISGSSEPDKDTTNCIICKYTVAEVKLQCNHEYCNTCLSIWLKEKNECTYCNKSIQYSN